MSYQEHERQKDKDYFRYPETEEELETWDHGDGGKGCLKQVGIGAAIAAVLFWIIYLLIK